jgi:spore germination protein
MGVGVLTLPRALAKETGTADGWMSILIAGLLIMVFVSLYVRLQRHFPDKDLLTYIGQGKLGKWVATILGVGFFIYWVCLLAFIVRILMIVIKMYLLPTTPTEVIVSLILLTVTYAVSKGTQGVIHLNLLFLPIVLTTLLIMQAFNIPNLKLENMFPILPEGFSPVISGLKHTIISFLGVEGIFFLMANMKKSDIRATSLNIWVGVVTLIYTVITIFCISIFGVEQNKVITFPTIELAKGIEVPGGFLEHMESLMITIWLMTVFNTMIMIHFLSVRVVRKNLLKRSTGMWLPALVTFITFILAFFPHSLSETFFFADKIASLGVFLIILSLVSGFITFWWRKKNRTTKEVKAK